MPLPTTPTQPPLRFRAAAVAVGGAGAHTPETTLSSHTTWIDTYRDERQLGLQRVDDRRVPHILVRWIWWHSFERIVCVRGCGLWIVDCVCVCVLVGWAWQLCNPSTLLPRTLVPWVLPARSGGGPDSD